MGDAPKDFKLGGLEFPRPDPQTSLSAPQLDAVARRSASGGVLALFGSLALLFLLWSAWCLGWLSATLASNILVVGALSLSGGYVIQLARFHRALGLPNMRLAGYITLASYWILVAGIIFKGIIPLESPTGGLFSLLLALEALIFYLTLREAQQDARALTLAVSATLLHLLGWLLTLAIVLEAILRYMDLSGIALLQAHYFPFPPILSLAHALQDHLGTATTLALAEAAILLAALLRVHFYHQALPNRPACSLLNPAARTALALFVAAVLFAQGVYHHIHNQWLDRLPAWEALAPATSADEDLAQGSLSLRQKDLGTLLVSLENEPRENVSADAPFLWQNFYATAQGGEFVPLAQWFPPVEGPDEEDAQALRQELALLEPALKTQEELLDILSSAPNAPLVPGLFLLEEWRFLTAMELRNADGAADALADFLTLATHLYQQDSLAQKEAACRFLERWETLARRATTLLDHAWLLENAQKAGELLSTTPLVKTLQQESLRDHEAIATSLDAMGHGFFLAMPLIPMLAKADDQVLWRDFQETPPATGRMRGGFHALLLHFQQQRFQKDILQKAQGTLAQLQEDLRNNANDTAAPKAD